jgi:hypothetical protein
MTGTGTKDDPWQLNTPPGTSSYQMYRDDAAEPVRLVCVVGSTTLYYDARCLDDLPAMLRQATVTATGTSYGDRNRAPRQPQSQIISAPIGDRLPTPLRTMSTSSKGENGKVKGSVDVSGGERLLLESADGEDEVEQVLADAFFGYAVSCREALHL